MSKTVQLLGGPFDGLELVVEGIKLFIEVQGSNTDGEPLHPAIYRVTNDPLRYTYVNPKDQ